VKEWWPGLVEAVHLIGSTQIQGRASIGGNLCNGSPAADSTCALIVNRAECIIAGPGGERRVPVDQFCSAPGRTVLQRGELLIAVDLPRPQPGTADAYLRLIPRTEMDIAVAGAAVAVTLDRTGRCTAARVAIGAVAPTALLVPAAGEALVGATFGTAAGASSALTDVKDALVGAIFATGGGTSSGPAAFDKTLVGAAFEEALTRAADLARAAARPIDDKRGTAAYRRHVVGVLVKRAAATAAARAKGQRA
jgi:carbon-monoxide dehydrogenase medium subunit